MSPPTYTSGQANGCVKRILQQNKQSKHVIVSINPDEGVKCIDTSVEPAKARSTHVHDAIMMSRGRGRY